MSTYTVDRAKFLKYYLPVLYSMTKIEKISEDILLGSEFIITATDLLEEVEWVSGHFWGIPKAIHHSKVSFTYEQSKEED